MNSKLQWACRYSVLLLPERNYTIICQKQREGKNTWKVFIAMRWLETGMSDPPCHCRHSALPRKVMNTKGKCLPTPTFADHFDPNHGRRHNNKTCQRLHSVAFLLQIYSIWYSVSRDGKSLRLQKSWNTNMKNIDENNKELHFLF